MIKVHRKPYMAHIDNDTHTETDVLIHVTANTSVVGNITF